jgi:hypothetical protein
VFGRQILSAGYTTAYAPKAVAYWRRPVGLQARWREQYNYGFGDGEAAIKTPAAYRLHLRARLPRATVPVLTAVRVLQKKLRWHPVQMALVRGDFGALLLMPLLLAGSGFWSARGYLDGSFRGARTCQQCRARLHVN